MTTMCPFRSRFSYSLYIACISVVLLVSQSSASQDAGGVDSLPFSVGLINKTPNFQVEVTMDTLTPVILKHGQAEKLFPANAERAEKHRLIAKAFTATKHFGRLQVGKKCMVIFQASAEAKDSSIGKVHWYKVFTYEDFLPQLADFSRKRHKRPGMSKRMRPAVMNKRQYATEHGKKWEKEEICGFIRKACERYRIPIALLTAVVEVESAFNAYAVSAKGAVGLMQLMPETCTRFSIHRPFDPQENVEGGAKYLGYLLHEWSIRYPSCRRLELSLAAFNAGEGRVDRYGGIPPFKETEDYVQEVLRRYQSLDKSKAGASI
jgi:hypothetical protein